MKKEGVISETKRAALLMSAAQSSPLTFDVLEVLSRGMDENALAILCGNVSMLPQNMKSSDIPYLSRSRMALRTDME